MLEVVVQKSAERGILGGEHLLAGAPAPLPQVVGDGGARREEGEVGSRDGRVEFFDGREVVEKPDGTAVGDEDKIVLASLNLDIVDRNCGEIILERRPIGAAIPRNP